MQDLNLRHITVSDGIQIALHTCGVHEGDAVVICNAAAMPVNFLGPLARILAEQYFVCIIQSRTLPRVMNEVAEVDVSLERQALDVFDVLDVLHRPCAHLVGWCSGARVALRFSALHADRVCSLTMLNGAYSLESIDKTAFEKNMLGLMPKIARNKQYANMFYRAIFSGGDAVGEKHNNFLGGPPNDVAPWAGVPYESADNLFLYAKLVNSYLGEQIRQDEFEIAAPTLVITGDKDITTSPLSSKYVAERICGARFRMISGADHFSIYRLSEYWSIVASFIAEINISALRAS